MRRPLTYLLLLEAGLILFFLQITGIRYHHYDAYVGDFVTITGKVIEKEKGKQEDSSEYLKILLSDFTLMTEEEGGGAEPRRAARGERAVLYVSEDKKADAEQMAAIGGTIRARGRLKLWKEAANPGQMDFRLYHRITGEVFQITGGEVLAGTERSGIREKFYKIRRKCAALFERFLYEEDAAFLKAALLGESGYLSGELKDLYKENGILHILSISGLHISLLGSGIKRCLRRFMPQIPSTLIAGMTVLIYSGIYSAGISAKRAIFMFLLNEAAHIIGRTPDLFTDASLALCVILLQNPLYLYHRGFAFSFASVMGISALMPLAERDFEKLLVLPISTMPVYLMTEGCYPAAGILCNLLAIPLMGPVLFLGMLLLLLGSFPGICGAAVSFPIHWMLMAIKGLCLFSASLPGRTAVYGAPKPIQIAVYVLVIFCLSLLQERAAIPWNRGAFYAGILAALSILVIRPRMGLYVHMLDVGQGDCVVIERNGTAILVDGGSSDEKAVGENIIKPFLYSRGIHRIKLMAATHDDADHINGLEELLDGSFSVERAALPLWAMDGLSGFAALGSAAAEGKVQSAFLKAGDCFRMGDMRFEVLHPTEGSQGGNEGSLTMLLTWESLAMLLTGDLEGRSEDAAAELLSGRAFGGMFRILKTAHHGSKNATGEKLLSAFQPKLALISCGRNNVYGHPHRETLARLREHGTDYAVTAENGEITLWICGGKIEVRPFF